MFWFTLSSLIVLFSVTTGNDFNEIALKPHCTVHNIPETKQQTVKVSIYLVIILEHLALKSEHTVP